MSMDCISIPKMNKEENGLIPLRIMMHYSFTYDNETKAREFFIPQINERVSVISS